MAQSLIPYDVVFARSIRERPISAQNRPHARIPAAESGVRPPMALFLGRQALAALGAPPRYDPSSAHGGRTGAKPMAAFSDEPTGLIGTFHGGSPLSSV